MAEALHRKRHPGYGMDANDAEISRIARGMPEGGEREYMDEYTLSRALGQRVVWESNPSIKAGA